MRYRKLALTRPLLVIFILFVGLAAGSPLSPTAEAALSGCRADPLVVLSDGTILDVSVTISTNVSNVTSIQYVVHGPSTARLVSVVGAPILGFTGIETFIYYADAQPNQYITETLVQTTFDHIGVTAYTTFSSLSLGYKTSTTLQYAPVTGFNSQVLRTVLRR